VLVWTQNVRGSLFVKLFLVSLVSGVLISIALIRGISFAFHPKFDPRMRDNVRNYVKLLMPQLGDAPEFAKGRALAESLGLRIRIEGDGWSWASSNDVPALASLPHPPGRRPSGRGFGPPPGAKWWYSILPGPPRHTPFEVIEYTFSRGPARVLVSGPQMDVETDWRILFPIVAFVLVVLLTSFLFIRSMLSPVRSLALGVSRIGEGNLDYKVPVESKDELGQLAKGFNEMVLRVREMIHSKKQLLVDVSHELRSPLTRAKVGLELIEHSDAVPQIRKDLSELEEMIETLLEEARLESGRGELLRVHCDASAIVKSLVDEYCVSSRKVLFDNGKVIWANVDGARFKSVVRNLVDNALKYSNDQPVEVKLDANDEFLTLSVVDQGIGIAPEEQTRVFEPFYRVDRSRARKTGGFGLGLSLCKKIVEAHSGTISIESALGQGTRVTVRLPLNG